MTNLTIKSIYGNNIKLEPFSLNLVNKNYLNWMNDKDISKFVAKAQGKTSLEDIYSFAKKMIDSDSDYFFAIMHKKNNRHIWNVRLGPIDDEKKISNFGILIGDKDFHGLGVGTEVMGLIKDFSFNYLRLKKLRFDVVKENTAAMKLYAKSNFKCLGESKKNFEKDGISWKLVEWTMLNPNN